VKLCVEAQEVAPYTHSQTTCCQKHINFCTENVSVYLLKFCESNTFVGIVKTWEKTVGNKEAKCRRINRYRHLEFSTFLELLGTKNEGSSVETLATMYQLGVTFSCVVRASSVPRTSF